MGAYFLYFNPASPLLHNPCTSFIPNNLNRYPFHNGKRSVLCRLRCLKKSVSPRMDLNASPSRYAQASVTYLPRRPKQLSEKVCYPANLAHVPRQWKQNKDFFCLFSCLFVGVSIFETKPLHAAVPSSSRLTCLISSRPLFHWFLRCEPVPLYLSL